MGLLLYHIAMPTVLLQTPPSVFNPDSALQVTWCTLHGILGVWFGLWLVWGWANPLALYIYYPVLLPPPPPPPTQNLHNAQAGSRRRRGRR